MSGWKTIPFIKCLWMIMVISFQRLSSRLMPWTLPGSALVISTRMLQWRRVGSVPVQKASLTMSVRSIQGSRSCLHWSHHVLMLSLLMPLGPGAFLDCRLWMASAISMSLGMLSAILNLQYPQMGLPLDRVC